VAYALSDKMKIIDLGWPWRSLSTSSMVRYPSDTWAFCWVCEQMSQPCIRSDSG